MEFITLTHFSSGDRVHIVIGQITSIRACRDRTLIVSGSQGQYVVESDIEIIKRIRKASSSPVGFKANNAEGESWQSRFMKLLTRKKGEDSE